MSARLERLRHVTDLYVKGTTVTLQDGSPLWVRVLNPFEQETARSEAQIARARLALAVREVGTDEQAKVKASFFEAGKDGAVELLVDAKVGDRYAKILEQLRYDPEWKERLDILARNQNDTAKPLEGIEQEAMEKIATEYLSELNLRVEDERKGYHADFQVLDEEALWDAYLELYIDRRASSAAIAEHQLHQILFGTFFCEGHLDDEKWIHTDCKHDERLFDTADEVRTLPEDLWNIILAGINSIDMSVVEAKNLPEASSVDSSPQPSEQAESTPSTPIEIPQEPTGS